MVFRLQDLVASQCLLLGLIIAYCYDFWHFHAASYLYGASGISMIVIYSVVSQAVSWIKKYQFIGGFIVRKNRTSYFSVIKWIFTIGCCFLSSNMMLKHCQPIILSMRFSDFHLFSTQLWFSPTAGKKRKLVCGLFKLASRHHNLDNDLRDRLGRQFSPERRPSLDRSGRRLQRFSGHENPRPFENRRGRDYRENHRFDEQDYAGGLKVGNRIEDRAEDGRNKFLGYNNVLEEQLKDVEMDVKMLTDDKLRLEASVERKAQEAGILTSRIQDLETQLDREKEECRRISSSTKKFVKEYNRFVRAQDDQKRSQARLQKLASQLSTYLGGTEGNDRDADVDIVSDEENNGRNLRTACDPNELQNTSSLSRKKHYVDQYTTKEPVEDALIGRGEEEKVDKVNKRPSRWNMDHSKSYSEEENGAWNDEDTINKSSSKEDNWKRRRFSFGTSSTDKVTSSTSMAARAFDDGAEFDEENPEVAKSSPLISLPPPPPVRDVQLQGDEEDANVDVMEQRKANDV